MARTVMNNGFKDVVNDMSIRENKSDFIARLSPSEKRKFIKLSNDEQEAYMSYHMNDDNTDINSFMKIYGRQKALEIYRLEKEFSLDKSKKDFSNFNVGNETKGQKGASCSYYLFDEHIEKIEQASYILTGTNKAKSAIIRLLIDNYLSDCIDSYLETQKDIHKEE